MAKPPIPARYPHLDMLRGMAAILVLVNHTRAFIFYPYGEIRSDSPILVAFYGMTSLGHEAVVLFFALSGYLVGGQALGGMFRGCWSGGRYALRRLTKLWILVVPGLLAKFALDWIGHATSSGAGGYNGLYSGIYPSLPAVVSPSAYRISDFVGNLLFLQTIAVPVWQQRSNVEFSQ